MKRIIMTLFILGIPLLASAQTYQIDWYVMGSGGGHSSSPNYQLDGTIGQPIVGASSSPNYTIEAGFWVGAAPTGGCAYIPGDLNGIGGANGIDVTYGVTYLKGGSAPHDTCFNCPNPGDTLLAPMDVNGSCSANGIDITFFVAYLKLVQPALLYCADCPPARITRVYPVESPSSIKLNRKNDTSQSQGAN